MRSTSRVGGDVDHARPLRNGHHLEKRLRLGDRGWRSVHPDRDTASPESLRDLDLLALSHSTRRPGWSETVETDPFQGGEGALAACAVDRRTVRLPPEQDVGIEVVCQSKFLRSEMPADIASETDRTTRAAVESKLVRAVRRRGSSSVLCRPLLPTTAGPARGEVEIDAVESEHAGLVTSRAQDRSTGTFHRGSTLVSGVVLAGLRPRSCRRPTVPG